MKNSDQLNRAIVDKVEKILSNTDYIDTLDINIHGRRGDVASVTYNIKELIILGTEEHNT